MLGLLAAGAAAVLVQAFKVGNQGPREIPKVDVLVADANLPARTRLTSENITVTQAPADGLPKGYFLSEAQAIGKVLKMAVVKGQPLTEADCIAKGSIDDLLRPGMLAFPAPLPKRSTSTELLYPGCVVDVFATFDLRNSDKGEAVVIPLLQNIQVLAIEEDTVLPAVEEKGIRTPVRRSTSNSSNVTVTLEVNPRQVAAIQLALQGGTLGLAMRNPLDKNMNPIEPMVRKAGQLTAASEALDAQTLALFNSIQAALGGQPLVDPNLAKAAAPVPEPNVVTVAPVQAAPEPEPMPSKRSMWQMTIIRGQKVEEAELDTPDETGEGTQEMREQVAEGLGRLQG